MAFRIFLLLLTMPVILQAAPWHRDGWSVTSNTTISDRSIKIEQIQDPSIEHSPDQNPMQRKERIITKFQERITQQSKKT